MSEKKRYIHVTMPERFTDQIDKRRGAIFRATYVQKLIKLAWEAGLKVPGEP